MKRSAFIVLAISLGIKVIAQQNMAVVTFSLHSPDLPDTTKVYVTGSHQELGYWNPDRIMMEPQGNHQWIKKISVTKPTSVEYKFTLGSWERQAADANGNEYHNFDARIKVDTVINHSIYFWTKSQKEKKVVGQVTGEVKYHKQLKGNTLKPRDIIVWLPPGYHDSKSRYPVVYMHDGQNIIDPATASFGFDWEVDETSDSLIRNNVVQPYIVVGINNTEDRSSEYTPGEKGNTYMKFIVEKVKPFIDSAYRTKPDRKNTIVGGSSAGGIISFMLVWEYPKIFSKAICMSPAFKIENIDYVKKVVESKKRKDVFFYIDNGGVGLESRLQPGIDAMMTALKQKGYKEGAEYYYDVDAKAKHFESDWAKRFPQAIKLVLPKK